MKCPTCHHHDSRVVESRDAGDSDAVRRRRECLDCKYRFTTYERLERPNLAVIKKDGGRELFDRNKLFAAIHRSVGKFLSSDFEIEQIVSHIENALYGLNVTEVPSSKIGDLIMDQLAQRNQVAYVRFASVYQEFTSLEQYEAALSQVRNLSKPQ